MAARVGRYELGRILGRGGQGRVYEAVLHGPGGLRKRVALKVLDRGEGLAREARMGGLLRHPSLVDVFEVGEQDGQWFCAMELCAGGTLASHAPLPARAVIEAGLQVCDALQYAHEELGLVHLDVKPQNLLLEGARVKVADLGIASARGFDHQVVRVMGSPGFMSPEQARGGPVDARSDVFALGVTLVALATGVTPASSHTFDYDDDDADPASVGDVPGWLSEVYLRATDPDPGQRYPSMAEFARALRALPADGPSLADHVRVGSTEADVAAGDVPLDAFVGRVDELGTLARWLETPGVITLKGAAGIGKSRLALEAAHAWRQRGGGSVIRAELAGVRARDGLLQAVSAALDVPLTGASADAWTTSLGYALAARRDAVLLLDDLDGDLAAAPTLARWAALAPQARLVVTSRGALGMPDARVLEVEPLPAGDAVALLVARAAERGVEPEPEVFGEIARRLDGVPLALELAAGRLGVLGATEVLDRLGLSLLRSSREGRQATLRGALDESWEALGAEDRTALSELSVFRGGFAVDAVEAVLSVPAPLDALDRLVARSLARRVGAERFDLLLPVREHAAERLADGGAAELRHGAWAAGLGSDGMAGRLDGHGGARLASRLRADTANLEVACRRALARGDAQTACRAFRALWYVLRRQGPWSVAQELAAALREVAAEGHEDRALVLFLAAQVAESGGQGADAIGSYLEALGLARARGEARAEGQILTGLGNVHMLQGRSSEAVEWYERALAVLGDPDLEALEAYAAGNYAYVCFRLGRNADARRLFDRALAIAVRGGNTQFESVLRGNLGLLHMETGDFESASASLEGALALQRAAGNLRSAGQTLGNLANLHTRLGRPDEELLATYEEALALHRACGNRRSEGVTLTNLGLTHHRIHRGAEGEAYLLQALAIMREVGDRRWEGVALMELANLWRIAGDLDRADGFHDQAEDLLRAADDVRELGHLLANRALLHAHRRDLERAEAYLTEAEAIVARVEAGPGSPLANHLDRARAALRDAERG